MKFKLAEIRQKRGLTQYGLAKLMGMTPQGLTHLEEKTKKLDLGILDRLCTVLECEISDLLQRIPDQQEKAS